jgi:four helix bundle protein
MRYEEWEGDVHERVRAEPIWQFLGYRKALFFYELVWQDSEKLVCDRRGRAIAEQLTRSAGSVSANVEEGHGRVYGKQRNWFFTVSIGSAREQGVVLACQASRIVRSIGPSPGPS